MFARGLWRWPPAVWAWCALLSSAMVACGHADGAFGRTQGVAVPLQDCGSQHRDVALFVSGHKMGTMWAEQMLRSTSRSRGDGGNHARRRLLNHKRKLREDGKPVIRTCGPPAGEFHKSYGRQDGRDDFWHWGSEAPCCEFGAGSCGVSDGMPMFKALDLSGDDMHQLAALASGRLWRKGGSDAGSSGKSKGIRVNVVHVVRDPRDVIVSGYAFHKRRSTKEPWLHHTGAEWAAKVSAPHTPSDSYAHLLADMLGPTESYQQRLNKVDEATGLLLEIKLASRTWLGWLRSFVITGDQLAARAQARGHHSSSTDPGDTCGMGAVRVYYAKYEAVWADPEAELKRISEALFPASWQGSAREHFARIGAASTRAQWMRLGLHGYKNSYAVRARKQAPTRPRNWQLLHTKGGGNPGKWRKKLSAVHLKALERTGMRDLLVRLGYETAPKSVAFDAHDVY